MNKPKRFYEQKETVWIVPLSREGVVIEVHKDDVPVKMTVEYHLDNGKKIEYTDVIWKFDKLKKNWGEEVLIEMLATQLTLLDDKVNQLMHPQVYFARVREDAVIPTKLDEDAGYDIYAELSQFKRETEEGDVYEIECPAFATTLVPTGFATAMPATHYLNAKHERGSTGVQSMSVLAGVIDSGYRDEVFIALTPLRKSVLITSAVSKVEENATHILYPLTKAIAQGTIDLVPKPKIDIISFGNLKEINSIRGTGKLGQSGK